jgi:trigger factor
MSEQARTTLEDVSPVRKRLAIEVPADEVTRELDRAYESVRRHAKLRGFRQGHAPRSVLERFYGDQVRRDVMARLVEASLRRAVEEHALAIVGSPEIDASAIEPQAPFRYTATVDIPPSFELADLTSLRAERRPAAVTDEDVEAVLGRLRDRAARLRPIEDRDVVEAGDVVTLDVTSRLGDGAPQKRSDVMLEAGSSSFEGGLENRLVGCRVGEGAELTVSYPEDYANTGLAGRTVAFEVAPKSLHSKELPPLDDDFAKDHGDAESLTDLRAKIRADLEAHAFEEAENAMREAILDALVDAHPFDLPPSVVNRRTDSMLASYGVRVPEGPEGTELLERLRGEVQPRAERDVRIDFVLDALAEREQLAVEDAEIDAEIEAQARRDPRPERVRTLYAREDARRMLRDRLLRTRAFEHVLGVATITDVLPEARVAPS